MEPGSKVRVIDAIDRDIHDVSMWIGHVGTVHMLGTASDELITVDFDKPADGAKVKRVSFWPEELKEVT